MITTKGRYGLRVMPDLAAHREEGFVPLKDIAQRQEISKKYLEIIIKRMVDTGLVQSLSGKGGGYCLTRKPEEYPLGEILEALEDSLTAVACLEENVPPCPRAHRCCTLPLWREFDAMVHDFFDSRTLADLLTKGETQ